MRQSEKLLSAVLVLLFGCVIFCCSRTAPRGWDRVVGPEGAALEGHLEDGIDVKLEVQKNTVNKETQFTLNFIKPGESGLPEEIKVHGGYVMELGPDIGQFNRPVVLSVTCPGNFEAAAATSLFHLEPSENTWKPVLVAARDPESGTTSYLLEHFSQYALISSGLRVDSAELMSAVTPGPDFQVAVSISHLDPGGSARTATAIGYLYYDDTLLSSGVIDQRIVSPGASETWPLSVPTHNSGTRVELVITADTDVSPGTPAFEIYKQLYIVDWPPVDPEHDPSALLHKHAPMFEFAPGERYRPLSIPYVVNNAPDMTILAPLFPDATLDEHQEAPATGTVLEILSTYGNSYSLVKFDGRTSQFRIDEGQTPTTDDYTVYGRAVAIDSQTIVLSYFMFFPYDPKGHWLGDRFAGHHGDRESISILLDQVDGEWKPRWVSFGQHLADNAATGTKATIMRDYSYGGVEWYGDVITLGWKFVDRYGDHPAVYVAEGSHGLYPRRSKGWKMELLPPPFGLSPVPAMIELNNAVGGVYTGFNYFLTGERAGGDESSQIWPPLSPQEKVRYQLEILPNLREIDTSAHPWSWLLYSGNWVTVSGWFAKPARIFPFIDRWYDPLEWMDRGHDDAPLVPPSFPYTHDGGPRYPLGFERPHPWDDVNFQDLSGSDWFYVYVKQLAANGVVKGDDATGEYRPADPVNRAEFLKMCIQSATEAGISLTYDYAEDTPFTDVQGSEWFFVHVVMGLQNGIICDPGIDADCSMQFRPGDPLNRAEAVKMLALAFKVSTTGPTQTSFPDVDSDDWFAPFVESIADLGIVDGYPDGRFRPANTINRAEAAKIVWLAMDRLGQGGD